MDDNKNNRINYLNRAIVSSAHINFLFGAGVNGRCFPQLDGFTNTLSKMDEFDDSGKSGFEERIDLLSDEEKEVVKEAFIEEFKENEKAIDPNHSSILHLRLMLAKAAQIVETTQNRTQSMNQINIYTLNYDSIVEQILSERGLIFNSISASNVKASAKLLNVIGYNYLTKKYLPSFLISKLHGDISSPIIPGKNKYKEVLNEDYFEIVFNMKEHLCKQNSILIVIGYSGNDKHINKILQECMSAGLKVFWYKYNENDESIVGDSSQLYIQEQPDYLNKKDTTMVCYEDMCEVWEEKLVE